MLNIQKNVKLADHSTFKIGGPAKEFVFVESEEDLIEAINYAKNNNLKLFILGGGSNVLFDDRGFDGLAIQMRNVKYEIGDNIIECGAGLLLSNAVNIARENNLSGFEWAVGIPGTIGGAVRGNAGAFGKTIADFVIEVKSYDVSNQKIVNYHPGDCDFNYRESIFKQNNGLIILSAKIRLKNGDKDKIQAKIDKILKKRSEKQPKSWFGNAGSFFMNPVAADKDLINKFEKETGNKTVGNRISAGWLIEEAQLKGKKIGNISVSNINANFLVNNGGGTMEEVLTVSGIIKQKVKVRFGIDLKEEIRIIYY